MNGLGTQPLTNINTTELKKPTRIRRNKNILRLSRPEIEYLKNRKGWTQEQIAHFCRVNERTIRRWLKRDYCYKPKKTGRKMKISQKDLASLMSYVFRGNNLSQKEMANYLRKEEGLEVSQQAVSRTLKKYDITYKQITYRYSEQTTRTEEIKKFLEQNRPLLASTQLLALDECGFHLNEAPRRSYATKGWRSISQRPGQKGDNHTLILCVQNGGKQSIIHHELIPKGMKTKEFHQFLTNLKLPNENKHYLLMDNLSVHRANQSCIDLKLTPIKELLASKNIQPNYLPPYTPQLNPVELCFNTIRKSVEKQKPRTYEELKSAIDQVIAILQEKDLTRYFQHSFNYFDENGEPTKRGRKSDRQRISNSKLPHYWPQIRRIWTNHRMREQSKNYYIRVKKNFPKSGHSFRVG